MGSKELDALTETYTGDITLKEFETQYISKDYIHKTPRGIYFVNPHAKLHSRPDSGLISITHHEGLLLLGFEERDRVPQTSPRNLPFPKTVRSLAQNGFIRVQTYDEKGVRISSNLRERITEVLTNNPNADLVERLKQRYDLHNS